MFSCHLCWRSVAIFALDLAMFRCRNSIQQLSACVDSVNEINRLVRLQLECESRTASVPAADLRCHLEESISSRQDLTEERTGREPPVLTDPDDRDNVEHQSDHSDNDTEDNGRSWASDYDDDMVFQLSDIDDDNNYDNGGTSNWADDTIQAIDTLSSPAWNAGFTQRIGDAVPPSFDDDSGNGYSCDSGSPCLLPAIPSLPNPYLP